MFSRMREAYRNQILRAFKQAPWRKQTQSVAALAVILLVMAVLGGFYLSVAARAGVAGRDLQWLEQQRDELINKNDELRSQLSELRSVKRMADRALAMGYVPVLPDGLEYLAVTNYPAEVPAPTPAAPVTSEPETLVDWLAETLSQLLSGERGGGS